MCDNAKDCGLSPIWERNVRRSTCSPHVSNDTNYQAVSRSRSLLRSAALVNSPAFSDSLPYENGHGDHLKESWHYLLIIAPLYLLRILVPEMYYKNFLYLYSLYTKIDCPQASDTIKFSVIVLVYILIWWFFSIEPLMTVRLPFDLIQ